METVLISLLAVVAIACVFWVVYSKFREEALTREKYAFRCLAAVVTLVALAVGTISSKKGLPEHLIDATLLIAGRSPAHEEPASISEQILIALLVAFASFLIFNSHRNWAGLISADEVNKRRLQRPNTLVSQALDESARLLRGAPAREVYKDAGRLRGDVNTPAAPPLVWHEHARELFELWYGNSRFGSSASAWDARVQCWIGRETKLKQTLLLFCRQQDPTPADIEVIARYAEKLLESEKGLVYVAHRGQIPEIELQHPRLVTCVSESFLLDHLVDFSDYYREIQRRIEIQRFPDSNTTLRDIYAPSSLMTLGREIVSDDLGRTLQDWAIRPPGRQMAILGDYGQGKSTGALMFVYESIRTNFSQTGGRIPILLELRGKSPANLQPEELLGSWSQQFLIHAQAMMKLLIAGRLIVIFEGFDEMANVSRPEERLAHFRALWQFSYPESKIVFTGRPNLFFEDRELELVFKTVEGAGAPAACEVFRLAPFDLSKIEISLRWADPDARAGIVSAARSSEQILDIVSRPSLLYIVATLWDELKLLLSSGNITSAHVIDRFIFHSYQRQADKERRLGFMVLTTSERRYFHEGLAVFMASRGTTNQITGPEMDAAIQRLFQSYPDDIHICAEIVMEQDVQPLKKRLNDQETVVETISTDVRTHGILVQDLERRGAFRFAHKSFYELLFAKSYAHEQLSVEPIFYNAVRAAMYGKMGDIEQSSQVIRFYGEVLVGLLLVLRHETSLSAALLEALCSGSTESRRIRHLLTRALLLLLRVAPSKRAVFVFSLTWLGTFFAGYIALFSFSILSHGKLDFARFWLVITFAYLMSTPPLLLIRLHGYAISRGRLWTAILLCADGARGSDGFSSELRRLVGRRAATSLCAAVAERWPVLLERARN